MFSIQISIRFPIIGQRHRQNHSVDFWQVFSIFVRRRRPYRIVRFVSKNVLHSIVSTRVGYELFLEHKDSSPRLTLLTKAPGWAKHRYFLGNMCVSADRKSVWLQSQRDSGLIVPQPPELRPRRTTFREILFWRTEVELEAVSNKIQAKPRKTMQTAHFDTILEYKWARAHPVSVGTATDRSDWTLLVEFWNDFGNIIDYSGNYNAWTLHVWFLEGFIIYPEDFL